MPEDAHLSHNVPTVVPEPPFSREVLADLDSGVYPDAVASHMRAHIQADPYAAPVLSALRTVRSELSQLRNPTGACEDIPADISARLTAAIERATAESSPENVAPLLRTRRWTRPVVAVLAGTAAAGIAVFAGAAVLDAPPSESPAFSAQPSHQGTDAASTGPLSAIGSRAETGLLSGSALAACLGEHGFSGDTPLLGSSVEIVSGEQAVRLLLPETHSARVIALTVRPSCGAGNPALISRTVLGS
ncbi:hypothetical protein [Hoyosella subflava]|uniref:Anti-sigma-M factor RsmA n=1 Tax=Hoyosella subflava (strain DSM 45089 / JCM 17490 / NBRC 109087 / DQS3-9A1) TaxID=443218 RepID=F6EPF6_HOYSD|nr:hypothetical protein [Hoyosella subflava]AEF43005.1 hypothetical protein AS9A_4573 [Hoyosella subflava DQS3-9A1]